MAKSDREALEQAMLAVDASIRTLVVARTVLEERLMERPDGPTDRKKNPVAVMGQDETVDEGTNVECPHLEVVERSTMGQDWYLCQNCGEMVDQP